MRLAHLTLFAHMRQAGSLVCNRLGDSRTSLCFLFWLGLSNPTLYSAPPTVEKATLANGLRLAAIHYPGSTNMAIFTFCPMGLALDGAGQSQWSHLVEHLVIHSTFKSLSAEVNAETLPDCLHLDFYGNIYNWQDGLVHHRRWLEGVPFTAEGLAEEKAKIKVECEYVARNLATHKFALAAWNQAYRLGQDKADLIGDVLRSDLPALQTYRDERLAVLSQTLICVVGGVETKASLAILTKHLEGISSKAKSAPLAKPKSPRNNFIWDLPARHLLLTWPIPGHTKPDHAELMVGAQWLAMRAFSDAPLKAATGMLLAGVDLYLPEGAYFYISLSLKPGADFDEVQTRLNQLLDQMRSEKNLSMFPFLSRQLSMLLSILPDQAGFAGQGVDNMPVAMLEANAGLQWGLREFRYGEFRAELSKRLESVSSESVRQAALTCLAAEKCAVCRLQPVAKGK